MTSQTQQQGHSFIQTDADKLTKGKQYLQVFGGNRQLMPGEHHTFRPSRPIPTFAIFKS